MLLFAAVTLRVNAQGQDDFTRTPKGDLCKKLTNNPGDKIKVNDVVTFDIIQKTEKDSLLGSTYMMGHPVKIQIQPSQNASDMMDVFPLLAAQDSAFVKVPTDSLFNGHDDQRPPFLPKGSYLIYLVKIHRVQSLNDAIAEKNKVLDSMRVAETPNEGKYIADHKLTPKTTTSGLKYFITKPSIKRKPLAGDTIQVNYTGHTLDGKVFDSSIAEDAQKAGLNQPGRHYEPYEFVVGTGAVIKGWDEGLLLLNEGSKAEFIIPSNLAYGSEGSGDIGPFATLVFDVELVKIKPGNRNISAESKDAEDMPLMHDIGFNPFLGKTNATSNFRTSPKPNGKLLRQLPIHSQVYIFSPKEVNGFCKAIDIKTGKIGWINRKSVTFTGKAQIDEKSEFRSTGKSTSYDPEVVIKNSSNKNITLIVGDKSFSLNPNSTIKNTIKPGNKYYVASSPGVIPKSGYQTFSSNMGYEWSFWIVVKP